MTITQGFVQLVRIKKSAYVYTIYLRGIAIAAVLRGMLILDILVCWYLNSEPLRQDRITTINVCLRRFHGSPVKLDDGSMINQSDLIMEIHLNNHWFLSNRDLRCLPGKAGRVFLAAFSEDLKYLAEQVNNETYSPQIKAIHGRTLLRQAQGNQLLGFTVMNIPRSRWRNLSQLYLGGLRQAYYPDRARRSLANAKPLVKKEIWMSRKKLLRIYGPSFQD
jgi:peptidoglycan-N-acetylglucosamine deacetylase